MEHPKHKILQIRNQSNDHKNNHVHVPLEPKCQHYVCMIEGAGLDLELVCKIAVALHV